MSAINTDTFISLRVEIKTCLKRMLKSFAPVILMLLLLLSPPAKAQEPNILKGLSVKGSVGLTAVHGDMTLSPFGKLGDAKLGFSVTGIKMFNPVIGIQFLYYSSNTAVIRPDKDTQFTGKLREIGLSLRIEPFHTNADGSTRKIYPYARIGISNLGFRAVRWTTSTSEIIPPYFGYILQQTVEPGPMESALAIPISVGFGYDINDQVSIELEHTNSISNTDYLDAWDGDGGGNYNDMYGFTNFGIRYKIMPRKSGTTKRPRTASTSRTQPREKAPERKVTYAEEDPGTIEAYKYSVSKTKVFVETRFPERIYSGKLFDVTYRIHKNNYKGPARITQEFPIGLTPVVTPIRNAVMKFEEPFLSIEWAQMPVDSLVDVVFHVFVKADLSGPIKTSGQISYEQPGGTAFFDFTNHAYIYNRMEAEMDEKFVSGNSAKNLDQKESGSQMGFSSFEDRRRAELSLQDKIEEILEQKNSNKPTTNPLSLQAAELPRTQETTKTGSNFRYQPRLSEDQLDQNIQNLIRSGRNNPESYSSGNEYSSAATQSFVGKPGIEFRVQCGAFRHSGEQYKLARRYNIREPLAEEYHNGLYKYTVGSLSTYQEAVRFRDNFIARTNLQSVFIVAYKDGRRLQNLNEAR